jgi:hypothetical protein
VRSCRKDLVAVADIARSYTMDLVDSRNRTWVRVSRFLTPVVLAALVPVVVFTHWWALVAVAVVMCLGHVAGEAWLRGQRRILVEHMWHLAAQSGDPISEMAAFQAFRRLTPAERRVVLAWEQDGGDPFAATVPPSVARFRAALRVLPREL